MIRSDVNSKLREFSRTLSPTKPEQDFVTKVYGSLQEMFGEANCIQIGSYPRYTATTPIHDLDILYVMGDWPDRGDLQDPDAVLNDVCTLIRQDYNDFCPDGYSFTVEIQNHSVVIEFSGTRDLSVDVVPCYTFSRNSYGQPMYKVPHVITEKNRDKRHAEAWNPTDRNQWILSDPRGYISQAKEVGINTDFRKAVKIVKYWKRTLRDIDDTLKLKSFHLEQIVTQQFQANPQLDLVGAIFDFFFELPNIINNPNQIEDRGQAGKYIDDYLANLTDSQKRSIIKARDGVLTKLEEIDEYEVDFIFTAREYQRNPDEEFIFDYKFIMCNDPESSLSVIRCDDHATRKIARGTKHSTDNEKLYFKLQNGLRSGYKYYWKVENSNKLSIDKRRGEITLDKTKNYPENTQYEGVHYVECYAVNSKNECESKHKHEVPIG